MSQININDFLLNDDLVEWSKKFGYSFYINIFNVISVDKSIDEKYTPYDFDDELSNEQIVELIKKSIKEDCDLIASHIKEQKLPDDALI